MKDETLIVIRFRFTKAFRRAVSHHFGWRHLATDEEVLAWAEMALGATAEDVVSEMPERRMNRR